MLFNNKKITNLENQIVELNARLNTLEAILAHIEESLDGFSGLNDKIESAIENAVESYDFSDAAREALESVANEATFTINF